MRVSEEEYRLLTDKAAAAGLSRSSLVRDHIQRVTIRNREDERQRLIMLNRINANLNMIAKWCNVFREDASGVEIIAELISIERALKGLLMRLDKK